MIDYCYSLSVVTAPTLIPVLLSEVKAQLRLEQDDTSQDAALWGRMRAALETFDGKYGRLGVAVAEQTQDLILDKWPAGNYIQIPLYPLQSIASLKYTQSDDSETTLDTGIYTADIESEPGRLVLKFGEVWPGTTLATANPIKIRFTAGYDPAGNDGKKRLPDRIKQAMLLFIEMLHDGHALEDVAAQMEKAINGLTINDRSQLVY